MGKIIATYDVKVTLREPDGVAEKATPPDAPTNEEVEATIIEGLLAGNPGLDVNATSQRTDI